MTSPAKLLLIGWDAAEWAVIRPLMNAGLMPNLTRLIERGAAGNLTASQPLISPIVWTSVVTGKRPFKHGVLGYAETRPDKLDVRPTCSYSRKSKAIWNILSQNGRRTHCINMSGSSPAEPINGVFVSREFIETDVPFASFPKESLVHPASLANSLEQLRIGPTELTADLLMHFIPDQELLKKNGDPRLHIVASALARTASAQAIANEVLQNHPWDFAAVFFSGLETISHAFMPFHPPKLEEVADEDSARFSEVVTKAYHLHDLILGRLVELGGSDAHVLLVSDHGFVTGKSRSAMKYVKNIAEASGMHRPQGLFILAGPSAAADELVEGATIYDVAPTILSIFNLPSSKDMDGHPIADALHDLHSTAPIESWETVAGESGCLSDEPIAEVDESVKYLAELGYKDTPLPQAQARITAVHDENAFNVACALIAAARPDAAVPVLERLVRRHATDTNYLRTLFQTYLSLHRLDDAKRIVQDAADRRVDETMQQIGLSLIALAENTPETALEHLRLANPGGVYLPEFNLLIGKSYLQLNRLRDADEAFARELEAWPQNEEALAGRAAVALKLSDPQAAAEWALKAVALRNDFADAHHLLGLALRRLDRPHDAVIALQRCIQLQPDNVRAIEALSDVLANQLNRADEARDLQERAISLRHQKRVMRTDFAASTAASSQS